MSLASIEPACQELLLQLADVRNKHMLCVRELARLSGFTVGVLSWYVPLDDIRHVVEMVGREAARIVAEREDTE